jgi:hypothetical protein
MAAEFIDIAIVDLDLAKTTWSRVHSSMRSLYLRLSREPDLPWIRFFHEERESRVVIKRHGLWIEDGYIVFDCLLADVETHHLPDFRQSLDYANQKSRELIATHRKQSRQRKADELTEHEQLTTLRGRIRGGDPPRQPASAAAAVAPADMAAADFESKRKDWRARFRRALKNRNKEPERGNE